MTFATVAKKDFQDAVRSRSFWALSVLFVGLALLTSYMYVTFPGTFTVGTGSGPARTSTDVGLILFLSSIAGLFVALTAVVICYKALAGERELGSMAILLGLPHTRRDVVVGKVLGRTLVLALPLVLGFGTAALYGYLSLDEFSLVEFGSFVGLAVLLALAWVAIVVGISAGTRSTSRASALAVGVFLVFELLWNAVSFGIVYAANGFSMPATAPDWLFVLNTIPPSAAFDAAIMALVPSAAPASGTGAQAIDAFYATEWLGVVVLLAWIVVPLTLGYWRFRGVDL
jgi:ABC-2 type transport system permease protein